MASALLSRIGLGGPQLISSVGRTPSLSRHQCPFLRAAQSLSAPAIPALMTQFKNLCPFLRTEAAKLEHHGGETGSITEAQAAVLMAQCPMMQQAHQAAPGSTVDNPLAEVERRGTAFANRDLCDQAQCCRQLQTTLAHSLGVEKKAAAAVEVEDRARVVDGPPRAVGEEVLEQKLEQLKKEGRYRVFFDIERQAGNYPRALNHDKSLSAPDEVVTFCSNDYLSMGQHPVVVNAMRDVLDKNGAGAGGTRNISGTTPFHTRLEDELADLHSKQKALVFTSCFVANDSSISTLAKMLPNCQIFSDADNHSSLIEGVRHSGCAKHIFRHNDVVHLEELMAACDPSFPKLIVFESVYSMDGDIAPIKEICDVADKYNALTFLDEVHAVGLYGHTGAGVAQQRNLEHRISLISGTLAKGYGVFGGYIAGSALFIDAVRSFAPGFIFTSSLPPAVAAGAAASIRYLKESQTEREEHQTRSSQLKDLLRQAGLPYMHAESHIVPVMVRDAELCKRASDILLNKHKVYVQPINFTTVPRGTERLRFTPGPMHSYEMLESLVAALDDVWDTLGLERVDPKAPPLTSAWK